jgi:hypothetical protein
MDNDNHEEPKREGAKKSTDEDIVTALTMLVRQMQTATLVALVVLLRWVDEQFLDAKPGYKLLDVALMEVASVELVARGVIQEGEDERWVVPEADCKVLEAAYFLDTVVSLETTLFRIIGHPCNPWDTLHEEDMQTRKVNILGRARQYREGVAEEEKRSEEEERQMMEGLAQAVDGPNEQKRSEEQS